MGSFDSRQLGRDGGLPVEGTGGVEAGRTYNMNAIVRLTAESDSWEIISDNDSGPESANAA